MEPTTTDLHRLLLCATAAYLPACLLSVAACCCCCFCLLPIVVVCVLQGMASSWDVRAWNQAGPKLKQQELLRWVF
jgi:hypothetical protein